MSWLQEALYDIREGWPGMQRRKDKMMLTKKHILFVFVVLTFVIYAFVQSKDWAKIHFSFVQTEAYPVLSPSPIIVEQEEHKVNIEIIHPTKESKKYIDVRFVEDQTVLDLTKKVVDIGAEGDGEMAFVTSIDGTKADSKKREFWALYVNGKMAEVGAGSYKVQNGDAITWKIETY